MTEVGIEERRKSILKRLEFSQEEHLERLEQIVERASRFLKIDPNSGRVYLTDEGRRLTVPRQILLVLIGRGFAHDLGHGPDDKMDYKEIAADLNRSAGGVSTELSDLVRERDVEKDGEGRFSVPFYRIEPILSALGETGTSPAGSADSELEERTNTPTANGSARRVATRIRIDKDLQEALAKPVDNTKFSWVKNTKNALDSGLAGLLIGRDSYGLKAMSCAQISALLKTLFAVNVSRGAISMAFLNVKGEHVIPTVQGREFQYSLSPLGTDYIQGVGEKLKPAVPPATQTTPNGGSVV